MRARFHYLQPYFIVIVFAGFVGVVLSPYWLPQVSLGNVFVALIALLRCVQLEDQVDRLKNTQGDVLNFIQGIKGAQGIQGEKGEKGEKGDSGQ